MNNKERLHSETILAGSRVFYIDVRQNHKGDKFVTITESKKTDEGYERHGIMLFEEDFDKFMDGMNRAVQFTKQIEK